MRLILHTHKRPLDADLCAAMNQSLRLGTDFTKSSTRIIGRNYYVNTWNVFVSNVEDTKRAMARFDKKHDTGLELEPLDTKTVDRWSMKVWDACLALLRVMQLTRFFGG